jgi:glycosyltransferase involved in cell wall biosynthesis
MIKNSLNFSILIATKNRPKELALLLDSITKSTILPSKLVIVFSGADINQIVSDYIPTLNIELIRSEIASQIFQKSEGIKALKSNDGWVLFLDDDVLIDSKAIEILVNHYICNDKYSQYVGFGLAIKNMTYRKLNILSKFLLYVFKLYSFKQGVITKSGHPQSYLHHSFDCDVSWLNGTSLWRSDVLKKYLENNLIVDYSSYEDVIFSYSVSKNHNLLFVPDVYVSTQKTLDSQLLGHKQFLYGSYLRYYFVDMNKEFSKFWLLIAQLLRSYAYVTAKNSEVSFLLRVRCVIKIWINLLIASINGINGGDFIKSKLN